MTNITQIQGGCHCGAVRFEAEADTSSTMVCNCSHCQIKGVILAFVPRELFRITKGEDRLTEYRFNKQVIAHLFCQVCGVQPFGLGEGSNGVKMAAINMRCVDGVEPEALTPQKFDGRSV